MTFEYFVKWIKELYKLHIYISSKLSKRTNTENVLLGFCLFFILLYFLNLGGKIINEDMAYCCKKVSSLLLICRAFVNAFELRYVVAPLSVNFLLLGFRFSTLVNLFTFFIIIRAIFFILGLVGIIILHQLVEATTLRNKELSSSIISLSIENEKLSNSNSSLSVKNKELSSSISSLSSANAELFRKNKELKDAISFEESKLEECKKS